MPGTTLPPKKIAARKAVIAAAAAKATAKDAAAEAVAAEAKDRAAMPPPPPQHRPLKRSLTMATNGEDRIRSFKRRPGIEIKLAFPIGETSGGASEEAIEEAQRQKSIQQHNFLLVHASGCRDSNCPSPNCAKVKALLRHGATCNTRATGGCPTCRGVWRFLSMHAHQCREPPHKKCPVPRCAELKNLFRQQDARRDKEKLLQELVDACEKYIARLADGAEISESDLRRAIREYLAKK